MVTRRGMLALVSALCVLASASAHAAGEFVAKYRKIYMHAYVEYLMNHGYNPLEGEAENAADCHMKYVLRGFTADEVAQLDAWAAGGRSPGELADAAVKRLGETTDSCDYGPTARS